MLFLVEAVFNFYSQRQTDQWGEKPSWKGFGLTFGLTGTIQRGDGFLASLRYEGNLWKYNKCAGDCARKTKI